MMRALLVRWGLVHPCVAVPIAKAPKAPKARTKRKPAAISNTMRSPLNFKPKTVAEFIGQARLTALTIDKLIGRSKNGQPIKVLLTGEPGIGKSALADYLTSKIAPEHWSVTKLNGNQLSIDRLDGWAQTLCYRELSGGFKVLRIDELDKSSNAAQVRLLTVLDDLPEHVAVIATSNKQLAGMESRLVSRFQTFELKPVPQDEIRRFLTQWPLTAQSLDRISTFACGNVRLALFEAQTALDSLC
jgi:replication-associated recombination protein RarA